MTSRKTSPMISPSKKHAPRSPGARDAGKGPRPFSHRHTGQGGEHSVRLYGLHTVAAALNNEKRHKHRLFVSPNALARLRENARKHTIPTEIITSSPRELDRLVGPDAVHQGVVLEASPLPPLTLQDLKRLNRLVVLDQITDPHNVGAIIRSACAFDLDAVILTARQTPLNSPVLAKSASGGLDMVPLVAVTNLGESLKFLKRQAVLCIGLDSEAPAPLSQTSRDQNIALVMGAEGRGLRHKTRQLCDAMVRLDMPGPIKSLNVSNAAAIAMYALTPDGA